MKFLIAVFSFGLAASAFAANLSSPMEIRMLQKKAAEAQAALDAATAKRIEIEGRVSAARSDVASKNCSGVAGYYKCPDGVYDQHRKAQEQLAQYQRDLGKVENSLPELRRLATQAQFVYDGKLELASGKQEDRQAATDAQNQALFGKMKIWETTNILERNFLKEKIAGLDVTYQLDAIEKKLDQTMMGAYFQDKIGALLNSSAFCEAVNQKCPVGTPKHVIDRESLKEIFPNLSEENSRSGDAQRARTWDKAKGTK